MVRWRHWAQQLLRLLSYIWHQYLKFMLLTWIVVPHILLFQSEVEGCPLGGWQTLSRVRTQSMCSTPSLEKEFYLSRLIKILVECKQRHYVSPKWINLREVLWESWIHISSFISRLTHFLHKSEKNIVTPEKIDYYSQSIRAYL